MRMLMRVVGHRSVLYCAWAHIGAWLVSHASKFPSRAAFFVDGACRPLAAERQAWHPPLLRAPPTHPGRAPERGALMGCAGSKSPESLLVAQTSPEHVIINDAHVRGGYLELHGRRDKSSSLTTVIEAVAAPPSPPTVEVWVGERSPTAVELSCKLPKMSTGSDFP